ncbi:MAG: SMC-Scp complex subunit ScpB [Candidatus Iainarchaeum archaeon]|uniref:SMC-Scp complex subunit ScpB n=1 Tax=Candidatus Iainarchaeum sp. TaxID=3101447 RepID=A0A7T9I1G0_9ARCH|nr:MAG: SMC-Scp complex subunit ScpB [Candidatus Diapherotrites archaeon]
MVFEFLKKLLGNKKPEPKEEAREENPFAEAKETTPVIRHPKTHPPSARKKASTRTEDVSDPDDESFPHYPEKLTEIPDEENETEMEPVLIPKKGAQRISSEEAIKVMEAALFMSSKGLSIEELGNTANLPLMKARELIPELVDGFNARGSALEIVEDLGGYRMKVRSPFDEKVNHLAGGTELSAGEMKTLAFIAYKQPLIQSQLVQVRSNTAYEHLQRLVEMGFVSKEPKGRTYLLRTTKKFSEYFGAHALKLRPMTVEEKLESRSRNMHPEENKGDQSASEDLV